jgi:hypothetical protein
VMESEIGRLENWNDIVGVRWRSLQPTKSRHSAQLGRWNEATAGDFGSIIEPLGEEGNRSIHVSLTQDCKDRLEFV